MRRETKVYASNWEEVTKLTMRSKFRLYGPGATLLFGIVAMAALAVAMLLGGCGGLVEDPEKSVRVRSFAAAELEPLFPGEGTLRANNLPDAHQGPDWLGALNSPGRWMKIPMHGPGGALPADWQCYRARTGSWDGSVRGWSLLASYWAPHPSVELTLASYAIGHGGHLDGGEGDTFVVKLSPACDPTEDSELQALQSDGCAFHVEILPIEMRTCRIGNRRLLDPTIFPPPDIWE